jgi:hypothetical protein
MKGYLVIKPLDSVKGFRVTIECDELIPKVEPVVNWKYAVCTSPKFRVIKIKDYESGEMVSEVNGLYHINRSQYPLCVVTGGIILNSKVEIYTTKKAAQMCYIRCSHYYGRKFEYEGWVKNYGLNGTLLSKELRIDTKLVKSHYRLDNNKWWVKRDYKRFKTKYKTLPEKKLIKKLPYIVEHFEDANSLSNVFKILNCRDRYCKNGYIKVFDKAGRMQRISYWKNDKCHLRSYDQLGVFIYSHSEWISKKVMDMFKEKEYKIATKYKIKVF